MPMGADCEERGNHAGATVVASFLVGGSICQGGYMGSGSIKKANHSACRLDDSCSRHLFLCLRTHEVSNGQG